MHREEITHRSAALNRDMHVMIHGHVHQSYTTKFQRQRDFNGIPVINAYTSYIFDLPETPSRRAPNRVGEKMLRKASEF